MYRLQVISKYSWYLHIVALYYINISWDKKGYYGILNLIYILIIFQLVFILNISIYHGIKENIM